MKRHLLVLALAGCGGGAVAKAPPPFRPEPAAQAPEPPPPDAPDDCSDTPKRLPSITYNERSIDEAEKLAARSLGELQGAETPGIDQLERERLITSAVAGFIDALLADPYNINATYNLAAAYARIGRVQCSVNLLNRLVYMRTHESKKAQVEAKLDRLLGRKKQKLDPDFDAMRGDPRFRELIRGLCAGSEDPGCVR